MVYQPHKTLECGTDERINCSCLHINRQYISIHALNTLPKVALSFVCTVAANILPHSSPRNFPVPTHCLKTYMCSKGLSLSSNYIVDIWRKGDKKFHIFLTSAICVTRCTHICITFLWSQVRLLFCLHYP